MDMLIMKNKKLTALIGIICLCIIGLSACRKETKATLREPLKDISGSWKIVKLVRNGEDLTSRIAFSDFRIVFSKDSTYSFIGKAPFIVNQSGTYGLDDPQYPFFISFTTKDKAIRDTLSFIYPIVDGQRQISLNISPGCSSNTYNYVFEKVQ